MLYKVIYQTTCDKNITGPQPCNSRYFSKARILAMSNLAFT